MNQTYDYNTGLPLAQGQQQSAYNTRTGQKIGSESASPTGVQSPYASPSPVKTSQPAVISSGTVNDTYIPSISAKADRMLPPKGVSIGSDGSWTDARTPESQDGKQSSGASDYEKILADIEAAPTSLSASEQAMFDLQQQQLDAQSKSAISRVQRQYAGLTKTLQERQASSSNILKNTLNVAGSGRYAPISSQNTLDAKASEDIRQLQELSDEENSLISQAESAKSEGEMRLLGLKLEALEKKKKEKVELAGKIADQMAEENKAIKAEQAKEREDIRSAVMDAAKGGAPKDVLERAGQQDSLIGAVSELGDYLNTTSGIIGEYNFYKRQAKAQGLEPKLFEDYKYADEIRKISVAQAAINQGGLTPAQTQNFLRISDKFQADTVMAAANKGKTAMDIADRVIADPNDPGGQLSVLYSLVTSLDPNSAVKEGEIALAQETQSYLGKFGSTLSKIANKQVVSPSTAKVLAEETKKLARAWFDAGKRREKQYSAQAQVAGIGDAFQDYLGNTPRPYAEDAIEQQKNAQTQIDDYYLNASEDERSMIDDMEEMKMSEEEIADYLRRTGKLTFKDVGGDTNAAAGIVAGYDIGSYATDPKHEQKVATIYSRIPDISNPAGADAYIRSMAPNSPVTGSMVLKAASKYGVDPRMVLAIMVQDSTLGTKGAAVRTFNPGNVGNTDDGSLKNYGSWEKGVEAVAKNLEWRKINNNLS